MGASAGIRSIAITGVVLMLSACGGGGLFGNSEREPKLYHLRSQTRSPDEFSVLPTKPLQLPEDLAALPEPTPGGSNITDPTPDADVVAALGGNPAALNRTAAPAASNALLAQAGRFGAAGDIRQILATEDLQYRRDHDARLLERVFNVNTYYRAYAPMSLDQYAELERWRAAGLRTVGAPPEESFQKK